MLWKQGQAAAGLAQLQEADRLNAPLLRKNAANTLYLANSIVLKTTVAEALVEVGRGNEAVRLARQALADAEAGIVSKLATPSQVLHSQLGLAVVLAYTGRGPEAGQVAAGLGAALESDPKLLRTGWLRSYFYSELGRIYQRLGQAQDARFWFGKSREASSRIVGGPILFGAPPERVAAPGRSAGCVAALTRLLSQNVASFQQVGRFKALPEARIRVRKQLFASGALDP